MVTIINAPRALLASTVVICMLTAAACASSVSRTSPVRNDGTVLLVPDIEVGSAGWCVVVPDGFSCPSQPGRSPILFEEWSRTNPPPVAEGYAVTTSEVATVTVAGGHNVATRRESELPDGLRAAFVDIRTAREQSKAQFEKARRPRFSPISASGKVLGERASGTRLLVESPTRTLSNLGARTFGSCRIEARPLNGLRAESRSVVTAVKAEGGLLPGALLSCATTEYRLGSGLLLAGVLLDALHPGRPPGPLPAMRPLRGKPGVFEAPDVEGEMICRRIEGGWLVVAKGENLQQGLTLLDNLRAIVNA